MPGTQEVQAALPVPAAHEPALHAVQPAEPPMLACPAGHGVQAPRPAVTACEPAGQDVQVAEPAAAAEPMGHCTQVEAAVAPVAAEAVPALQATHVLLCAPVVAR